MTRVRAAARAAAVVASAGAVLAGCAAPADLDGELARVAATRGAAPHRGDPVPVVVDTDLGADDLAALAFLVRHPGVEVRAVTVAATGLVGCEPGVDVVAGLVASLGVPPVPVACGRPDPGAAGRPFPEQWRSAAAAGSGITPVAGPVEPRTAVQLLADEARAVPDLVVVALGPMTNVAELAERNPADYARLRGVHAMAGSVAGPALDGVAEWNAAADPAALETVLGSAVPVTVVPEDAVPLGTPAELRGRVVDRVVAAADVPAWWDLAAAAALVAPDAGRVEAGGWSCEDSTPGRLVRSGPGEVRVVRSLDGATLAREYARAFSG